MRAQGKKAESDRLPDYYETVVQDVLDYVDGCEGVWLDVGSGAGGVGLALARRQGGVVILLDPNADALGRGLERARQAGLGGRVVAVVGTVEHLALPDGSVDAAVSRGSFFFWDDRAGGLREIYRVLRPGGKAMIGGGLGRRYPRWARREFIRRRRAGVAEKGPGALRRFREARSPATFRRLATEAELPAFEVLGEGGLGPDHPDVGLGIWLRFCKETTDEPR
ncbi:MAG: class I SAM-dependent methyltransferase [Planctomycetota bacterium]